MKYLTWQLFVKVSCTLTQKSFRNFLSTFPKHSKNHLSKILILFWLTVCRKNYKSEEPKRSTFLGIQRKPKRNVLLTGIYIVNMNFFFRNILSSIYLHSLLLSKLNFFFFVCKLKIMFNTIDKNQQIFPNDTTMIFYDIQQIVKQSFYSIHIHFDTIFFL